MNDKELKTLLVALVESTITVAHTAYYGHEMAWGCYQMLVEQAPDKKVVAARYRKALHGAGKLTRERDELIARLKELLQKLNAD